MGVGNTSRRSGAACPAGAKGTRLESTLCNSLAFCTKFSFFFLSFFLTKPVQDQGTCLPTGCACWNKGIGRDEDSELID